MSGINLAASTIRRKVWSRVHPRLAQPGTRVVLENSTRLVYWRDLAGPSDVMLTDGAVRFEPPADTIAGAFYRLRVLAP